MLLVNGLITNDKFCMTRSGRLTLSWSRYEVRQRRRALAASDYPSLEQSQHGGIYETPVADAAADHPVSGWAATLGSGVPLSAPMDPTYPAQFESPSGGNTAPSSGGA